MFFQKTCSTNKNHISRLLFLWENNIFVALPIDRKTLIRNKIDTRIAMFEFGKLITQF